MIEELAPDVVHVHHTLQLGVEMLDLIRRGGARRPAGSSPPMTSSRSVPRKASCSTTDGRLCTGPTLDGCLRCFPGRPAADLVMRDLQMRDALADFDRILVPSAFARGRYLAAGWPAERASSVMAERRP